MYPEYSIAFVLRWARHSVLIRWIPLYWNSKDQMLCFGWSEHQHVMLNDRFTSEYVQCEWATKSTLLARRREDDCCEQILLLLLLSLSFSVFVAYIQSKQMVLSQQAFECCHSTVFFRRKAFNTPCCTDGHEQKRKETRLFLSPTLSKDLYRPFCSVTVAQMTSVTKQSRGFPMEFLPLSTWRISYHGKISGMLELDSLIIAIDMNLRISSDI